MRKIVLTTPLCSSFAFGVGGDDNSSIFKPETLKALNEQEAQKVPEDLAKNNFYLNINPKDIKELQEKDKTIKEHLDKFDGAILNYKPVIRPMMTNDEIQVHPYFSTTVLLPVGAKISYTDISIEPQVIKAEQNTILLRMKKDFEVGNLTVLYKIGEENYVLNIMLKRYDRALTDEKLSLVYSYQKLNVKSELEVMSEYVRTYGKYPTEKVSYVWLDGITYRLIEDKNNGTLMFKDKKYLVDIGNAR